MFRPPLPEQPVTFDQYDIQDDEDSITDTPTNLSASYQWSASTMTGSVTERSSYCSWTGVEGVCSFILLPYCIVHKPTAASVQNVAPWIIEQMWHSGFLQAMGEGCICLFLCGIHVCPPCIVATLFVTV